MRILLMTACLSAALTSCTQDRTTAGMASRSESEPRGGVPVAVADLKNAKGETVGTATFRQTPKGVNIVVDVHDVTSGRHGIHIHQTGACAGPDFKSAGEHFNPTNERHGAPNGSISHAGDLGNITVGNDGTGRLRLTMKGLSLKSNGNALLREGGTSVVLHAQTDDLTTDPSGNSGARIACGDIHLPPTS